jgi:hypothetical protein
MQPEPLDEKSLFWEALAGPAREAYLDGPYRADWALRVQVDEVLGAPDRAGQAQGPPRPLLRRRGRGRAAYPD